MATLPVVQDASDGPAVGQQDEVGRLAEALPGAVGPFFRLLRRAVAVDHDAPALTDARVDLLRLVERRPGIAVGEAASELRVAPNTVSTLVGELVSAGLVARRRGRSDRRTSALHLTDEAVDRLRGWAVHRQQVLAGVLDGLDAGDRATLSAALPALARLQAALEERAAGLDRRG